MQLTTSQWGFLLGCMPARLALAFVVKSEVVPMIYTALVLAIMASGFLYLFFTGKRTTGIETQGRTIWWRPFRLVHGLFYLAAAALVFKKASLWAFYVLCADALIGLGNFIHHYTQ